MSTLEASFLRVESPSAHMHVGWFSALELPSGVHRLDARVLIEQIESRLHLALGVLSYDGGLHFAAYADPEALPAARPLPVMLEEAVEELAVAVRPERRGPVRGRRGAHTHNSLTSTRSG